VRIITNAKNFVVFLWNWYVIRPLVYFFPPRNDTSGPSDKGQTLHED
jgi:hypothetical protein